VIGWLTALLGRRQPVDDPDAARIRRDGFPGRGTVVSLRSTGRRRRGRSELELTLNVFIPRRRPFEVAIRPWVTDAERARLTPGRAVPVAADQGQPGHVVLAFDMDEAVSIAGLGPVAGGPGGPPSRPTPAEPEGDR
jgi:hypothetical protein